MSERQSSAMAVTSTGASGWRPASPLTDGEHADVGERQERDGEVAGTATMPTCIGVSGASIARLVRSTALSRANPMVTETSNDVAFGQGREN